MVYCIQAYLIFSDPITRAARLAQAQSFILNKERWDVTQLEASDDPDPNAIYISTRFISKSDLQQVDLATRNFGGIQPGSWIQIHDCDHDEIKNSCLATVQRTEF